MAQGHLFKIRPRSAGGLCTDPDAWYLRNKFSEGKGKRSLGAVMLSHSVHILSVTMGGGKPWELLKNTNFPNNLFTERGEIDSENNYLKIIKEEGTGSHCELLGTC